MVKQYLTKDGFTKLQEELYHLRTFRRQEVAERLREAMSDGDSGIDNDAECEAAKNAQAFVEGRIRELETLLANVKIIEDTVHETVQIGATVKIRENGTKPEVYTIVGAAETDPRQGKISNESPLGRALMDHRAGDEVLVEAPNGSFTVKIIKVE